MNGLDIKIARIKAGLYQYQLADRAKIQAADLSLIETGRKRPTDAQLARILAALAEVEHATTSA